MNRRFDYTELRKDWKDCIVNAYNILYSHLDSDLHSDDRNAILTACSAIRYLMDPVEREVVKLTKRPYELPEKGNTKAEAHDEH